MMEKDSFERLEVASVLNRHFISIKVDREERPDVDQIYMDVVTGLTGHGGWPMSVFMTPDKKPFWGGTFVKKEQFISLSEKLNDVWQKDPQKVLESAESIVEALRSGTTRKTIESSKADYQESWKRGCEALVRNFDKSFGGFGPAPKFPPSQQIQSLLAIKNSPEEFEYVALTTLEHLGKRALFDHVEGGFHRYATDTAWEVPHFEKMLYDNALLIPAFLEGFFVSQYEPFLKIAAKTAHYLLIKMQTDEGLFKSAEDAGDVGKEGEYYVWSTSEIQEIPAPLQKVFIDTFEYVTTPNFEDSITLVGKSLLKVTSEETTLLFKNLLEKRKKRVHPLCDYKVITSWNGLTMSAFSKLYRATNEKSYLQSAQKIASHFQQFENESLVRIISSSKNKIQATLEDYTFLIEGLINLYQCDFNESWLLLAKALQEQQDNSLWSDERHLYKTSAATDLIVERFELVDGAMPSPNSIALENTKYLSKAFESHCWFEKSHFIDQELSPIAHQYPSGMNRYFLAMSRYNQELIAVGQISDKESMQLKQAGATYVILAAADTNHSLIPAIKNKQNGRFFLCTNGSCELPSQTLNLKLAEPS